MVEEEYDSMATHYCSVLARTQSLVHARTNAPSWIHLLRGKVSTFNSSVLFHGENAGVVCKIMGGELVVMHAMQ